MSRLLLDNLLCQGTLLPWSRHAPGSLFLSLSSPVCSHIFIGLHIKMRAVQTSLICQAIKLRLISLLFTLPDSVCHLKVLSVMA